MKPDLSLATLSAILFAIAGNVLPLIGRVFWGWNTAYLLLLFWVETCVIFMFNYLKMRKADGASDKMFSKPKKEKLSNYLFMGFIFLGVLGINIAFSTFIVGSEIWRGPESKNILPSFDLLNYGISLVLLIAGNIVVYWRFMRNGAYRTVSVEQAQGNVFARMLLLFFVALIGVFLYGAAFSQLMIPLLIFVVLKSIGDAFTYIYRI